jgi:hypothetical protein
MARRRAAAVAAAIAVHAIVALGLASQPTTTPPAPQTAIVLDLTPLAPRSTPRDVHQAVGSSSAAPAAPSPPIERTQPPSVVAATPTPPAAPSALSGDGNAALSAALRAEFRCSHLDQLASDERVRCAERLARGGAPSQAFGMAPAQRAYFDAKAQQALWWQQPILGAIPKNGCALLVTNQQAGLTGGETTADSRWRALPPSEAWRTGGPSASSAPTDWKSSSDWRPGVGCGVSFFNANARR